MGSGGTPTGLESLAGRLTVQLRDTCSGVDPAELPHGGPRNHALHSQEPCQRYLAACPLFVIVYLVDFDG